MPSISVPLKGEKGWDALMKTRREFWSKGTNNAISKNFKATEFFCHDGSAAPTKARPAMQALCKTFLEPMRTKFGTAYVLSGYRHELYNASIGGARQSQHIYEQTVEAVAADMRFAKGTPAQWAAFARGLRAKQGNRGGVGRYDKSGFVHVDNRDYKADWSG
jgi:uncharacterized protein YcbK (DUF882 family)